LGGNKFSDYLAINNFIKSTKINNYSGFFNCRFRKDYLKKIVIDWNWLFYRKYTKIFKNQFKMSSNTKRFIDVQCRCLQHTGWIKYHRSKTIIKLKQFGKRHRVIACFDRVDLNKYLEELRNSKLIVSPFGWGEICIRAFEGIMAGCLVVQPSVDHLIISPDIWKPYKTYVPVKWDLSDLQEKCQYFLDNEDERNKIIRTAIKKYKKCFKTSFFINNIKNFLERLNL